MNEATMRTTQWVFTLSLLMLTLGAPVSAQEASVPEPPSDTFDLRAAIAEGPPLSAREAADLAAQAAPSITETRALARAAEAAVSQARAAMLPRLALSASYQHVDGFEDGAISMGGDPDALAAARSLAGQLSDPAARALWQGQLESQGGSFSIPIPRDRFAFSARLTWPVSDVLFAMLPALDAAEAAVDARGIEEEARRAAVRRSATEAYYRLALARGAHAIADEAGRLASAQLAQVEAAARAGFLTEADRLGAVARVAETVRMRRGAQASVEIASAALATLLGRPLGEAPFGVRLEALEAAPEADAAAAVEARPELRALRRSLDIQSSVAQAEQARAYPHLGIYAGADYANPNRYQVPPQSTFTPSWEVGVSLSWAPNDLLGAAHRGEELGARRAATEAQLEQLERMVRLEVQQARSLLEAQRAGIEAAQAAEVAARSAYEARLAQVRAGHATVAELFAAEAQLHSARLRSLESEVGLRLADAQLRYATGSM